MKKYEDESVRRRGRENGRDRDFDDFSEDDRYDQGEYEERMDRYDRAYEDRRRNSGQKKKGKKKVEEEEEDGLYEIHTRVYWSDKTEGPYEEIVTYLFKPPKDKS